MEAILARREPIGRLRPRLLPPLGHAAARLLLAHGTGRAANAAARDRITAVADGNSDGDAARQLALPRAAITQLPPEIAQLRHTLTQLNLSHNRLTTMPPELFALANLETLDLRDNYLWLLPPAVARLRKLNAQDVLPLLFGLRSAESRAHLQWAAACGRR